MAEMADTAILPALCDDLADVDAEQEVLALLRGGVSDDFSLTILRTGERWTVSFFRRAVDGAPELAGGRSFADAWDGNVSVEKAFLEQN